MIEPLVLHTCCAPCLSYVHDVLRTEFSVLAYFCNPNIQPPPEHEKRRDAFSTYTQQRSIPTVEVPYDSDVWFAFQRQGGGDDALLPQNKAARCARCYQYRLEHTARYARDKGYEWISTTLLYSIYQAHDTVRAVGKAAAKKYGVQFYYKDFREKWKQGIELYRPTGLYRQKYCGCLQSMKK